MSGIIVPIVEKRIFEFSFLGAAGVQEIVLHPAIDVGAWYRVRMVILTHQISATSGNFIFALRHAFPFEQDRQEFGITGSDFLATSGITTSPPNLTTVSQVDPSAYLKFVLKATQGTAGNPLYGEFSAYLVLRDV